MILSNDRSPQLKLHEKAHVEDPFLDQLEDLSWEVVRLQQVQVPADSFRTSFDEVILRPRLEEALRKINPFLRDEQVAEAVQRISTFPPARPDARPADGAGAGGAGCVSVWGRVF